MTREQKFSHMSAARFRFLMRKNGFTIKTLAKAAGVYMYRVRELRDGGIYRQPNQSASSAEVSAWGWNQILTRRDGAK